MMENEICANGFGHNWGLQNKFPAFRPPFLMYMAIFAALFKK
jgi:hypothetical protein